MDVEIETDGPLTLTLDSVNDIGSAKDAAKDVASKASTGTEFHDLCPFWPNPSHSQSQISSSSPSGDTLAKRQSQQLASISQLEARVAACEKRLSAETAQTAAHQALVSNLLSLDDAALEQQVVALALDLSGQDAVQMERALAEVINSPRMKKQRRQQQLKEGSSSGVGQSTAERTYVMCKPDGVQRGCVGEIISRFEA